MRTENLHKMGLMTGNINSRYRILDQQQLEQIRSRLNTYISKERTAHGLEDVKQAYFDFLNYYNSISSSTEVRTAVAKKKQASIKRNRQNYNRSLAQYRNEALSELEEAYGECLSSVGLFQIGIKRKLKDAYIHKKNAILYATDIDAIDNLIDSIDDDFSDICDDDNY
jgi:DNA repair ATPase RecN